MKVLVIFAHPAIHKSRVNRELAREAKEIDGITFHDLYQEYPDLVIDVEREQALLLDHDVIVFQHPMFWYSTPAIIKEWQDLVLEYGFAYGEKGDRLAGKAWVHALSTGGAEAAYTHEGHKRFTVMEFLTPLRQSAHLCEMVFLHPFVTHSAHQFANPQELEPIRKKYRRFLEALVQHGPKFSENEVIPC